MSRILPASFKCHECGASIDLGTLPRPHRHTKYQRYRHVLLVDPDKWNEGRYPCWRCGTVWIITREEEQ